MSSTKKIQNIDDVFGVTNAQSSNIRDILETLKPFKPADVASVAYEKKLIPPHFNSLVSMATKYSKLSEQLVLDIYEAVRGIPVPYLITGIVTAHREREVIASTVLNGLERAHRDKSELLVNVVVKPEPSYKTFEKLPVDIEKKVVEKQIVVQSIDVNGKKLHRVPVGQKNVYSSEIQIRESNQVIDVVANKFGVFNVSEDKEFNEHAYRIACLFTTFCTMSGGKVKTDGLAFAEAMMGISADSAGVFLETVIDLVFEQGKLPDHMTSADIINHVYTYFDTTFAAPALLQFIARAYTKMFPPQYIKEQGKPFKYSEYHIQTMVLEGQTYIYEYPVLRLNEDIRIGKAVVRGKDYMGEGIPEATRLRYIYQLLGFCRAFRGQDKNRISSVTRCYRVGSMVSDSMRSQIEIGAVTKQIAKVWQGLIYLPDANGEQLNSVLLNCSNPVVTVSKSANTNDAMYARHFSTVWGDVNPAEEHVTVYFSNQFSWNPAVSKNAATFETEQLKMKANYDTMMKKYASPTCKGYYVPVSLVSTDQKLYNMFNAHRLETVKLTGVLETVFKALSFQQYVNNFRVINLVRNYAVYGYNLLTKVGEMENGSYYLPFPIENVIIRLPSYKTGSLFGAIESGGEIGVEMVMKYMADNRDIEERANENFDDGGSDNGDKHEDPIVEAPDLGDMFETMATLQAAAGSKKE